MSNIFIPSNFGLKSMCLICSLFNSSSSDKLSLDKLSLLSSSSLSSSSASLSFSFSFSLKFCLLEDLLTVINVLNILPNGRIGHFPKVSHLLFSFSSSLSDTLSDESESLSDSLSLSLSLSISSSETTILSVFSLFLLFSFTFFLLCIC